MGSAQFEILNRVINQIDDEPWKKEHDEVQAKWKSCDGLATVTKLLIFTHNTMQECIEHVGREHLRAMTLSGGELVCLFYERWYNLATSILEITDELEKEDFPVEESGKLRGIHRLVTRMLPTMKDLRRKVTDFKAGRGTLLEDVLNGMESRIAR